MGGAFRKVLQWSRKRFRMLFVISKKQVNALKKVGGAEKLGRDFIKFPIVMKTLPYINGHLINRAKAMKK